MHVQFCDCYVCSVLCIRCTVVCKCELYRCHQVSTQLQLNIYHIIISYQTWRITTTYCYIITCLAIFNIPKYTNRWKETRQRMQCNWAAITLVTSECEQWRMNCDRGGLSTMTSTWVRLAVRIRDAVTIGGSWHWASRMKLWKRWRSKHKTSCWNRPLCNRSLFCHLTFITAAHGINPFLRCCKTQKWHRNVHDFHNGSIPTLPWT